MMTLLRGLAAMFIFLLLASGCASKHVRVDREEAYRAYEAGKYVAAAEHFTRLVDQSPKDAELWFRLGNAHGKANQPEQAIAAYENALLRAPTMSKAWYNKGIIHLQQALKAFVDMAAYTDPEDPIGRRAEKMRETIFDLLEAPAAAKEQ